MKRIWTRLFRSSDATKFWEWINNTKQNLFDKEILTYPATGCLVAHGNGEPIVYLPIQYVPMLESLAINPESSLKDVATSLWQLVAAVQLECQRKGMGEIYFLCKEESTIQFAQKNGFTEIPYKLFRMKLSDMEQPTNGNNQTK